MSGPALGDGEPITDKRQLIEYLAAGCKPATQWRVGTEHERFLFRRDDLKPVPYDGERGVLSILAGLEATAGWNPVIEGNAVVALVRADGASVSLEPGGQIELSGVPVATIHEARTEIDAFQDQVRDVGAPLGVGTLPLGFNPKWRREDVPWMPKGRYRIMRDYMPKKGGLGLDMMLRTCTVQANLDFSSERDMVRKFQVALALQPIATALWANSPFTEGKPNGYLSYRSHVWTDTDPDRSGILPFVFDEGMGFEAYVDYMLDVPMYFVFRHGQYIDASGQSFRDFMAGRLPAYPGHIPTEADWADHLTTAFPEVRLKRYLEMRGADVGGRPLLWALPAFWVGLLYAEASLDAALDLVADWTPEDHALLRRDVPRLGLKTPFKARTVREIALVALDIAEDGLRRRGRLDERGADETAYLAPMRVIAESGRTQADELLARYHGAWDGSVDPAFTQYGY